MGLILWKKNLIIIISNFTYFNKITMAQIEEEELTRLKEASNSLRESRSTIADIEISMHRLESKKKAVLYPSFAISFSSITILDLISEKLFKLLTIRLS